MKHFFGFLLLSSLGLVVSNSPARSVPSSATARQDTTTVLMCMGPTAYSYHNQVCQGLSKCSAGQKRVSIREAQQLGRRACGYCFKYR